MNDPAFVPLSDLAVDLQIHRTHVKKFAVKHGAVLTRIRTRAAGNQETLAVSAADAEMLREVRQEWIGDSVPREQNGKGWFYVVQVLPELEPRRVKLGFATDTLQRLHTYWTICPNAMIVKTWPCRFVWEQCAIASATRIDCEQIGQELFHCDDLAELIERCDTFFALLPNPHI